MYIMCIMNGVVIAFYFFYNSNCCVICWKKACWMQTCLIHRPTCLTCSDVHTSSTEPILRICNDKSSQCVVFDWKWSYPKATTTNDRHSFSASKFMHTDIFKMTNSKFSRKRKKYITNTRKVALQSPTPNVNPIIVYHENQTGDDRRTPPTYGWSFSDMNMGVRLYTK